jgi:hypothetical protein
MKQYQDIVSEFIEFLANALAPLTQFLWLALSIYDNQRMWSLVVPSTRMNELRRAVPHAKYALTRECALSYVTSSIWGFRPSWSSRVVYEGVFVMSFGSFGNQVISFVNARYFASVCAISRIFCHSGWLSFQAGESFQAPDGVEISIARDRSHLPYPEPLVVSGVFFYSPPICEDWSWKDVLDGVAGFMRKPFPPLVLGEHELVIVLRGGREMWVRNREPMHYMQAPCKFFLDVMLNFSSTLVIGGDGSPCKDMAIKAGGQWIPWHPIEGTRYMLYARNIAFARTSRSHAAIALAPFRRRFWLFDVESEKRKEWWWRGFKPYEFGEGYDCVASSEYRRIGSPWIPTEEQIQLVRNGGCEFRRIDPS